MPSLGRNQRSTAAWANQADICRNAPVLRDVHMIKNRRACVERRWLLPPERRKASETRSAARESKCEPRVQTYGNLRAGWKRAFPPGRRGGFDRRASEGADGRWP